MVVVVDFTRLEQQSQSHEPPTDITDAKAYTIHEEKKKMEEDRIRELAEGKKQVTRTSVFRVLVPTTT